MIKNLSFVWLLFVVSCSQPNQSSKTNLMPFDEESIIDLGSLSLNTELIEEVNTISSDSIDFASVEKGKMVTQSLIIVNKQLSPLVISESDIDLSSISPFELISNSCIGRITRNRSCQIKLRLSNPNPSNQNISLTKSLKIHNATITLTGEQKLFIENNDPIIGMNVSPLSLDFGVLKNGQAKEMSVIITNKTISAQTINLPVINSNKIIMTNNCSSSLQRNRSCSIKFKYSASEDEERLNEELISIANNPIKYSVNVESPTNEAPEETLVSPNGLDLSLSLTEPELKKGSVTFVNNGLENFPSPVVAISSHSGIIINSTSCSGGLSRRRTCLVQYSINTSLLPSGISSQKNSATIKYINI